MRSPSYVVLLGAVASVSADVVSSELHCVTAMGPKPVYAVQTVSSTTTVTLSDATSTTIVTDTVTAAPTTDVVTDTTQVTVTTTESTVTDTFTSTSTETETTTLFTTQTDTLTETATTTTTTTDTTVIPTPSGFVPISDTLNGFPQRKRRNVGHPHCKPKGSVYSTAAAYLTSSTSSEDCGIATTGSTYAQSVACSETITEQQTATATTTTSMTITAAPVTSTTTETITSTSTEVPRAETTETLTETTTASTTSTITETQTQTETVTETATAPPQTKYAACSADNILSSYNGQSIINVYNNNNGNVGGGSIFDNAQAPSAEDCCALCFNTAGCTGTAYLAPSRCVLLRNAARTCESESANPAVFIVGNGVGYTLSNSACGYIKAPPS